MINPDDVIIPDVLFSYAPMGTIRMFEITDGNCILLDFQPEHLAVVCQSEKFDISEKHQNITLAFCMLDRLNNKLVENAKPGKWILDINLHENLCFLYVASIPSSLPIEAVNIMVQQAWEAIKSTCPKVSLLVEKINRNEASLDDVFGELEDQMHVSIDPLLMLLNGREDDE